MLQLHYQQHQMLILLTVVPLVMKNHIFYKNWFKNWAAASAEGFPPWCLATLRSRAGGARAWSRSAGLNEVLSIRVTQLTCRTTPVPRIEHQNEIKIKNHPDFP